MRKSSLNERQPESQLCKRGWGFLSFSENVGGGNSLKNIWLFFWFEFFLSSSLPCRNFKMSPLLNPPHFLHTKSQTCIFLHLRLMHQIQFVPCPLLSLFPMSYLVFPILLFLPTSSPLFLSSPAFGSVRFDENGLWGLYEAR